ncbi:MAG: hypothetical protein ACXW05_12910 [Gemmatirosa sp.]
MARRIRGVLGMGLIWAIGGMGIGGLIELIDNVLPAAHGFTRQVDMWPQTLAIPGFVAGVVFAIVLGIAGGRRRFEELSFQRFAAWGAVTGLLVGALGMSFGAPVLFLGVMTVLSVIGASSTLGLARLAERRGFIGAGATRGELVPGEARERLVRSDGD